MNGLGKWRSVPCGVSVFCPIRIHPTCSSFVMTGPKTVGRVKVVSILRVLFPLYAPRI